MIHRTFVLLDMQTKNEPLYVELRENVPIQNQDQIVCGLSYQQVEDIIEASEGSYLENHIYVPNDIRKLVKRKGEK